MAQITRDIYPDTARKNNFRVILAKQFDENSRYLRAVIQNEGRRVNISDKCAVMFNVKRADGKMRAILGSVNKDGSVLVPLTQWLLSVVGTAICSISIIEGEENKLTTMSFEIQVEQQEYIENGDITEDENYDILVDLIAEVTELKNDTTEATDSANSAAELANSAAGAATSAASLANEARENLEQVVERTETATENANKATQNANDSAEKANVSAKSADSATERANKAADEIAGAVENASEALNKATDAAKNAEQATTDAQAAISAANEAIDKADTSSAVAEKAAENANNAANKALDAVTSIESSVEKAEQAVKDAETATTTATAAAANAEKAVEAANTAKQEADAATKTANDAAQTATSAGETATAAAGAATAAAGEATSAATSANEATAKANEAATKATEAAENVSTAIEGANTAASAANTAADSANKAAAEANKWSSVTAVAKTLDAGAEATATLTETEDGKQFAFGIPKGEKGDTADLSKYATKSDLNNKVDKDGDKQLSTNDYTNEDKQKLAGIDINKIDEKIAKISEKVDDISIGGRNLLLDSGKYISNSYYNIATYTLIGGVKGGDLVTLSIKGSFANNTKYLSAYNSGDASWQADICLNENGYGSQTFVWNENNGGNNTSLYLFIWQKENSSTNSIEWVKLELGNKATDWTPAPEDLETTAENFEGTLPVDKGGTGTTPKTISEGLNLEEFRTQIGINADTNSFINTSLHISMSAEIPYQFANILKFGAADTNGFISLDPWSSNIYIGAGTQESINWVAKIATSSNILATQLAIASIYEIRTVSSASADVALETPTIEGELTPLDKNMVRVYADLCLNPDSGKTIEKVPEHLRVYVSEIIDKTIEESEKQKLAKDDTEIVATENQN